MNEEMKRKYSMVPYYKMGIKLLTDVQLENVFHNYRSLLNKVTQYRQSLEETDFSKWNPEEDDNQIYLMYDNVFSIMGKRGAGKTSVIFTLKNMLQESHPNDLVLPIIMPEIIPEGQGLVGWILAVLDPVVKKLEKKMEKSRKQDTLFSNCSYEKGDTLSKQLQRIKDLYFSQDYTTEESGNFMSAVVNAGMRTQNSFDFGKELTIFWSRLVAAVKKVNGMGGKEQPLIHIFFDDVDLRPEFLMSLFSTIMKYLSYPNLIIYVTADEDQLYDVIESTMNQRMGKNEELKMYGTLISPYIRKPANTNRLRERIATKLDIIDQTPKFYSDKILPPSSRYYLETFDTCLQKRQFLYSVSRERPSVPLFECFLNEIDRYIDHVMPDNSEEEKRKANFLKYGSDFINIYLIFCGETSRQLGNAVFKLSEFVDELIAFHDRYKESADPFNQREILFKRLYQIIFDYCSNMLGMLAGSNEEKWQTRQILRDILTHRVGRWGMYINYINLRDYVHDRLESEEVTENREHIYRQAISIFVLMFFIENFLKIESEVKTEIFENSKRRIHGQGIFIEVLDMFTNLDYSLVWKRQTDDIRQFLWFYGALIDSPQILMNFDPRESRKVRAYFRCLPSTEDIIPERLETYDRENPMWFRTMVFILYASGEGIYNLRKSDFLLNRLNRVSSDFWDRGVRVEFQDMQAGLISTLSVPPTKESLDRKTSELSSLKYRNILTVLKKKNDESPFRTVTDMKVFLQDKYKEQYQRVCAAYISRKYALPLSFGPDSSYSEFLNALQTAADKIEEAAYSFDTYQFRDLEAFVKYAQYLDIDYTYQLAFDLTAAIWKTDDETVIARRSDLNRIMRTVFNELARTTLEEDYFKSIEDGFDIRGKGAYRSMIEQVEFYLQTERDFQNAADLLALCQYFIIVQDLYFQRYLFEYDSSGQETRVDKDLIPYKKMYQEIRDHLIRPRGFLSETLQRYVREGIEDYTDSLK